jgi:predicted SnoaL-like aldol condensation-catalyzing enzyme
VAEMKMGPDELVQAVFARVRAADPTVADLYGPDASLETADRVVHGREAIAAFYRDVFQTTRPQPSVEALFVNLPVVVALLRIEVPDGAVRRIVDVFHVDDGAISSMRVCSEQAG